METGNEARENGVYRIKICLTSVLQSVHTRPPPSQTSYFDILVPTIDTKRYGFLMEKLLDVNRSVLFTGTTGVGKVSGNLIVGVLGL